MINFAEKFMKIQLDNVAFEDTFKKVFQEMLKETEMVLAPES